MHMELSITHNFGRIKLFKRHIDIAHSDAINAESLCSFIAY